MLEIFLPRLVISYYMKVISQLIRTLDLCFLFDWLMTYNFSFGYRLSKKLHQNLLSARTRIKEHGMKEKYRMVQEISEIAASARSIIHKKVRESRAVPRPPPKQVKADSNTHVSKSIHQHAAVEENGTPPTTEPPYSADNTKKSIAGNWIMRIPTLSSETTKHSKIL